MFHGRAKKVSYKLCSEFHKIREEEKVERTTTMHIIVSEVEHYKRG